MGKVRTERRELEREYDRAMNESTEDLSPLITQLMVSGATLEQIQRAVIEAAKRAA